MSCDHCKKFEDFRTGSGLTWPCGAYRPIVITNADRIRAMSVEKLAEFLERVGDEGACEVCGNFDRCRRNNAPEPVCSRHIKSWLQQSGQVEGEQL